jgi:hypothetical protein
MRLPGPVRGREPGTASSVSRRLRGTTVIVPCAGDQAASGQDLRAVNRFGGLEGRWSMKFGLVTIVPWHAESLVTRCGSASTGSRATVTGLHRTVEPRCRRGPYEHQPLAIVDRVSCPSGVANCCDRSRQKLAQGTQSSAVRQLRQKLGMHLTRIQGCQIGNSNRTLPDCCSFRLHSECGCFASGSGAGMP